MLKIRFVSLCSINVLTNISSYDILQISDSSYNILSDGDVAQFGGASALHAEGCRFDAYHLH